MARKICYCFDYTEDDIRDDLLRHDGHSSILERIVREKQQGACRCHELHPEGR